MRTITKPSTINLVLLALLSLALTAGCGQVAGGVRPPAPQPPGPFPTPAPTPPANTSTNSNTNTIRFWRDYSKSVDEETLAQIVGELADAILRHKERIVGIEVVRFANASNSVWAEMPVRFIWGPAPVIPEFKPDLNKATQSERLFKDAMKRYVERERLKYEEQKALLLSDYERRVEEQLKEFTAHLLQIPTVGAPCTQFTALAERMRAEDLPYSVLITDGWADCPDEKGRRADGVELHGKHAIIQLTRHADLQVDDKEFLRRKAFLNELFPASEVMPAYTPGRAIEFIFSQTNANG